MIAQCFSFYLTFLALLTNFLGKETPKLRIWTEKMLSFAVYTTVLLQDFNSYSLQWKLIRIKILRCIFLYFVTAYTFQSFPIMSVFTLLNGEAFFCVIAVYIIWV